MYKIYRFLVILAVVHSALAVTEPEQTLEDIINQIFGVETDTADTDASVVKPTGCVSVEGSGPNCYECRFCNDSFFQNPIHQTNSFEVKLNNDKCTAHVNVCCVNPANWLILRSNDRCGNANPDGIPRRRRQFPRSMLQAEFPWRAWVYSKSSDSPLCAATFIHEDKMALLTLASCVRAHTADTLEVAFIRNGPRAAVIGVIMHENYSPDDDSNNIAILQLVSLEPTPLWSYPACLPQSAPPLATPCVTTTAADLRIEAVIPVRSACTRDNKTLPASLTCALAPPRDYEPETAAGLYCGHGGPKITYTLNGIFTSENQNIASYVDVWKFMPWVKSKLHLKD